jgi:hypothetical protein
MDRIGACCCKVTDLDGFGDRARDGRAHDSTTLREPRWSWISDDDHHRQRRKRIYVPGILFACSSAKTDRPAPTDVTDDRPVLTCVRRRFAFRE